MKNLAITLLFSTFSLVVTAQTFDDNFLKNFEKVYQKDPVQFLKNEVGSDFTIIYGDGRLGDKESVLKIYEAFNQVSRTVTELKTRQLGSTGIATGILNHTYTSKKDGSLRDNTNRFTYSFTLQNGKWNLVAVHLTDMPPMPPFDEKTFAAIMQSFQKDLVGYLKTNTAPDYTFTSNGQVMDAKTLIKRLEAYTVTSWLTSNVKVRQYGTTAFVTGTVKAIYTSKADGSTIANADLFSYTLAYQGGKWLLLGGQHSDIPIDIKQEETAIKTVVEAEWKAYHDGNTERVRSYWRFTPQTRAVATTIAGQTLYANSGDELSKLYTDLKPDNITFSNANYNIKINSGGNSAFVTYDQTSTNAAGKVLYLSHDVQNMERVNGVWKIAAISVHSYKPEADVSKIQPKVDYEQTIQKGNQVGIHTITVELKPNVTMEQVLDFYNTKWIPDADKYFGWKFYSAKCLRGTGCAENKILLISHHKTEADRNKYFKMAEGGRDLNELGAKAWAQFAPTNDALKQLATTKDEWIDWVIK